MTIRTATATALAALTAFAAGCGGSDAKPSAGSVPNGSPAAPPTATVTFATDGLTPARQTLPKGKAVTLVVVSADGRPHAAVVTIGARRTRVVIGPDARTSVVLDGLQSGRSYKFVPDGATEPVVLFAG